MLSVCAVSASFASNCWAHFLWLKTVAQDGKPQAFLFFGESPADEAYHLPEPLAKTKVWRRAKDNKRTELPTENLETEDRIGLTAPFGGKRPCTLEATQQYGIYGQSLLVYYAKHVHADVKELNAAGPSKERKLDIVPRADRNGLELTVRWGGKPLADAELTISVNDGEAVEQTTDKSGRVYLTPKSDGLVGVLASHMEKDNAGELDGKKYKGVLHYASLTFEWNGARKDAGAAADDKPPADLAPLPEPVSSFGAAVADGWLYVYGGHTGEEHDHSAANLSKHFRRIKLEGGAEWEELPTQTPLQGLALVAHGGNVYRIGGMSARNPTTKDKEDLHSTAEFSEFNPSTGKWRSLAPLPTPRSSHNAVVIGDRLYVVGGWRLKGPSRGEWQPDGLVFDFAKPNAGWQTLPEPSFKRRALAAGEWRGRLVALGGMDETAKPSRRIDFFDPQSGRWSQGPDLPGTGLAGFGVSAWNLDGNLYVSGFGGIVYRLNETGSAWEEAARLATPRFFHQLVPATGGGLLAVGGASREGHLADIEWIEVRRARQL